MREYLLTYEQVLKNLKTNKNGLSEEEAKDRLIKNGKNKLEEGKKISLFSKFIKELINPMIIILIVAAIISGITAY